MESLAGHIPQWLRTAAAPLRPVLRAARLWSDADGLRMSAAMSFYGILSLAPLLIVMVAVLGWWLDRDVLENGIVSQIGAVVGDQGGALVKQALASAKKPSDGILASILGFGVLLFGATGVFTELQEAFERLWRHGRTEPARQKWWHGASLRLRGVGYILAFGFMLLVSLVFSTMLALFSGWAGAWMGFEAVLRVVNELVSFIVSAALFLALMRISSGPKPPMKLLIVGAVAGAILFTIGRQLMTLYLSTAAVVSAYGTAGSLIVLLMWIYFSSAVLLFSAGFARALEEER
ncbi:YihY family inner membrane protein [Caenimonas koreensis DSM 17982]|uniref:YihY family inner membrane protein n=1 Tax=Caenimonas koreensis DSM 17982 TaxID=1121255 RepID=A0A844B512_9BURK|nr:YihY/virulence factor BrkB family protein [Caenimonas koreensis]MRD46759.1 YihY family inner membrane protein [Caenimonas koreensis DSM 17982]